MSPASNDNTMKSLYNMALACCDNQALRLNLLNAHDNHDASQARMQMMIGLATKKNKVFKNYAAHTYGS